MARELVPDAVPFDDRESSVVADDCDTELAGLIAAAGSDVLDKLEIAEEELDLDVGIDVDPGAVLMD